MRHVAIMCGIPGSGKSTLAKQLTKGLPNRVVSADNFFMQNGEYQFDISKLHLAHNQCLREYVDTLQRGYDGDGGVVVDNTNCNLMDIAPYYRLAQAFGYMPTVIVLTCDATTGAQRNLHNVPESITSRMEGRLRKALRAWPYDWRKLMWTGNDGIRSMLEVARYDPRLTHE